MKSLYLLLALLPALLAPTRYADPARADLVELEAWIVATLEDLAEACQKERAFAERNSLFEGVLVYSPDHADARKALGYKRDPKNGEWKRARNFRTPKNYDPDAVPALIERRDAWLVEASDRLLTLLETATLTASRSDAAVRRLLEISPDDEKLRARVGQARAPDGEWLSIAGAHSLRARAEREAFLAELLEMAPDPGDWTVDGGAAEVEVEWSTARFTTRARVAGTVPEEEVVFAAKMTHVLQDFLRTTFAVDGPQLLRRGNLTASRTQPGQYRFTVLLCGNAASRDALIAGFPRLSQENRALFPKLKNGWLDDKNTLGVWSGDRAERLDNVCRQRIGAFLRDHFGLSTKAGWIWEGFGMYLTYQVLGTRKTFFVRHSPYVGGASKENLDSRITAEGSDWLALTLELLNGEKPPDLNFTLGRDVNSMMTHDLLLAYALAAYLVDAHPDKARNVLVRCGRNEPGRTVLESELGTSFDTFKSDWKSWLEEVGTEK